MAKSYKALLTNVMLVLVSVVLIFVSVGSFTFAWFSSQDAALGQFSFGGAVMVEIANQEGVLSDGEPITLTYAADNLLPGIKINPFIYTMVKQSTTTSVLRARLDVTVAGLTPEQNDQLNFWFVQSFTPQISDAWDMYSDGWFYFLGSASSGTMVMTEPATTSGLTALVYGNTFSNYTPATNRDITGENTVLGSVNASAGNVPVPFLTHSFRLPYNIDNTYANATISLSFYVEAIQDYIINESETNVLPTIANVKPILDSLSPTHDALGNLK